MRYLIKNATLVNEGKSFMASVLISGETIEKIIPTECQQDFDNCEIIDAKGLLLLPGAIDDQVHFRDPGLTHKGDIATESRAAIAGGVTSFMDMPNTVPNTLTQQLLQDKYDIAAEKSMANYSFYMGVSNDNVDEVLKTDPKNVCGIKAFMGSSTGNMLVNNELTLQRLFQEAPCLIATHCEDEDTIRRNMEIFKAKYGDDAPASVHPLIRSEEACYKTSSYAAELASKYGTQLHILHLSTAKEIQLFNNNIPLKDKKITAETCLHYLLFDDRDYETKKTFLKCNPAVKTENDKLALIQACIDNHIDILATDHAPHTFEEKNKPYFSAPSGGTSVQHLLLGALELAIKEQMSADKGRQTLTIEKVVELLSHNPAILFKINKRGFIREGYYADLVLVNPNKEQTISNNDVHYKCGWTAYEGMKLSCSVTHTFVNGELVYDNGKFKEDYRGKRLTFNR
ncbi:MAG: dihydroorotase [Lentimicrobiaceae bacterium]|nr:dihydroorotase [Lentimicrobiaceae bacterium]